MTKVYFKEEQQIMKPWHWFFIIPIWLVTIISFSIGFYQQFVLGIPWGDKPMTDTGLLFTGIFVLSILIALTLLFFTMKLIVEVRGKGIRYRYPPVIRRYRSIQKELINRFEVRKYKPIIQYGGWGIRVKGRRMKRRNWGIAYSVSGNIGMQLYLKDGKKVLFGTQRSEAFERAVVKMMRKEE
ncbi:MAG: hypothetical protein H8D45_27645 [Bacteroidetes bacterium]|nr:hypothetical protein [Bacteroidota bacterium]MBL7102706.1 hypothetical protein [Bacteroidales bacterium]